MRQTFRAVIFDLDGVLADSEPWWNQIDAKLLREYGATYHGQYHREVLGVSYPIAVEFYKKKFGISAPTEEMMKRRGEIATEYFANRVGLFPSTKDVLNELREMKLRPRRCYKFGQRLRATVSGSISTDAILRRHHHRRRNRAWQTGSRHLSPRCRTARRAHERLSRHRRFTFRYRRSQSRKHTRRRHSRSPFCRPARV